MPSSWRKKLSDNLISQLKELFTQFSPKTIHAFIPFGTEADIYPILQYCLNNDIKLVTPRIQKKPNMLHLTTPDLAAVQKNKFGIRETTSNEVYLGTYDIILVPGVTFDYSGYRIGYGGGYYDQFLAQHPEALKIGIAFPIQISKIAIPHETHDVAVDLIITGKKIIKAEK